MIDLAIFAASCLILAALLAYHLRVPRRMQHERESALQSRDDAREAARRLPRWTRPCDH